MRFIIPFFLSLMFFLASHGVQGQSTTDTLRVVGVVIDQATAMSLPNVTIKNKRIPGAMLTDSSGYFSLRAAPGDTLLLRAVGYQPDEYIVPTTEASGYFAIIELIREGAVHLREIVVRGRGFPTQQQFEQIFLQIEPGELSENTIQLKNHIDETVRDRTNMQQYFLEYRNRRQTYWLTPEGPPNDFFNPERWVRFIRDWQDGLFTDEAVEKLEGFPPPDGAEQLNNAGRRAVEQ